MNRNRYDGMIFLALLVCTAGCNSSSDESAIQGSWEITQMATNGEYLPQDKVNKDGILVFQGNKYIRKQKDKVQNEWTFTLDPSKTPKQLLVNRGMSGGKERFSYLIYKIEGDTLTTKSGSPSFPKDFTTETDQGCYLTVFKRSGS